MTFNIMKNEWRWKGRKITRTNNAQTGMKRISADAKKWHSFLIRRIMRHSCDRAFTDVYWCLPGVGLRRILFHRRYCFFDSTGLGRNTFIRARSARVRSNKWTSIDICECKTIKIVKQKQNTPEKIVYTIVKLTEGMCHDCVNKTLKRFKKKARKTAKITA